MGNKELEDLTVEQVVSSVAEHLDADVIHYNGPVQRPADTQLIQECITRRRRKNILLLLVTTGGDADPAYRIARCLQTKYERFFFYVSGYCKSAGTLVASGAHELVISDHGELGPLDVQMSKKDELWEVQSGLTVMDTLSALQDNAFNAFEKFFLSTKVGSGGSITMRTAAQIATEMTTGLFAPLYGQVDPLNIGEAARAMSIAGHYGRRLLSQGQNIEPGALDYIMSEYPSHGFVIDRQEASRLFKNVREPTPMEGHLAKMLGGRARWPDDQALGKQPPFKFLTTEPPAADGEDNDEQTKGDNDARPGEATRSGLGDVTETARKQLEGSNGEGNTVAPVTIGRRDRDKGRESAKSA